MGEKSNSDRLTADEVLHRYQDLGGFSGILLQDVNQVNIDGDRPLHVAAVRGDLDEIRALVHAGADIDPPGDLGYTPLHEAVAQGHVEAVEFLLDHGASLDTKTEFGDTALDLALLKKRAGMVTLLQSWIKRRQSGG